jgi:hypothetical protein
VQKLDPSTLFSIFDQADDQIYKEHGLEDLLQNPYVVMGTVVTGVENFYLIDKIYCLRFKEQYERVRSGIKLKYYSNLYNYLTEINLQQSNDLYTVDTGFDIDRSLSALKDLLYFFETIEHYEKCAIIKKFTDLLCSKKLEYLI